MIRSTGKKHVSHLGFGQKVFDTQCKDAIQNLEAKVEQAFKKAVNKTDQALILMSQAQAPRAFFSECITLLSEQTPHLLQRPTSKLTKPPTHAISQTPFQMKAPLNDAHLSLKSLQRLQSAKTRNANSCLQAYRTLLRQGPLLTHLQTLPDTVRILLDASPENCQKNLHRRILKSIPDAYRGTEHGLIVSLILASYFFSNIAMVYSDLHKQLSFFFEQHLPQLNKLDSVKKHDANNRPIRKKVTKRKQPPQNLQLPGHKKITRIEPELTLPPQANTHQASFFELVPIQPDRQTAIERQILERVDHEHTARTQLKQLKLGSILQWQGSHFDRKTQVLKVVNHEHAHNLIVFADEHTGDFVRYKIETLVQAWLSGDIKKLAKTAQYQADKGWSHALKKILSTEKDAINTVQA